MSTRPQDPSVEDFNLDGSASLSFLDIAEIYLRRAKKPLSAREIVALATHDGTLVSTGKTPWQTMKSKLSTDILANGRASRFKRVFQGVFALRDYDAEEYHANRFIKSKLDEQIAVIRQSDLRHLIENPGYTSSDIDRAQLGRLAFPMQRRIAEDRFDVIQLVSVFIVTHKGKYLTHMRSARLPESRLRGEYSLMLGGHLAVEDFAQLTLDLFSDSDDLSDCTYILRELSEELILDSNPIVEPRGFLYDVSRDVSKQHLGIVYLVTIPKPDFQIGERGFLMNSQMESMRSIRSRRDNFENWSWILMDCMSQINRRKR